jgi:hypothetical protein
VVVLVAKLEIAIIFLLFYIAWAMMNNVVGSVPTPGSAEVRHVCTFRLKNR